MNEVQAVLGGAMAAAFAVALWAAWRERARKRRRNLDAIGLIAWPTVQVLALLAFAICGALLLQT